jgi:hypothetical protein
MLKIMVTILYIWKGSLSDLLGEESKHINFKVRLQIFLLQECAADEKDDGLMEKV